MLEDMEADQDGTKRKQLPKGSTGTVKENNGRGYYIVFDASYKLGEQPIRYEQMHKLEPLWHEPAEMPLAFNVCGAGGENYGNFEVFDTVAFFEFDLRAKLGVPFYIDMNLTHNDQMLGPATVLSTKTFEPGTRLTLLKEAIDITTIVGTYPIQPSLVEYLTWNEDGSCQMKYNSNDKASVNTGTWTACRSWSEPGIFMEWSDRPKGEHDVDRSWKVAELRSYKESADFIRHRTPQSNNDEYYECYDGPQRAMWSAHASRR